MRAPRPSLLLACALAWSLAGAKANSAGWVIVAGSKSAEAVTSHDRYDLLNLHARAFLALRPGRNGDELTVRPRALGAVRLVKADGTNVRCGDRFALRVDNGNVVFGNAAPLSLTVTHKVDDSIYQWRIGNCTGSAPILTNASIALYNERAKDALVGCARPWGPPFCWDEKQNMGLPTP